MKHFVKRAHFQSAVWLSAMTLNLPNLDPTKYGWEQDKINEVLCLIGILAGVSAAPPEVLKLIKCTCSSTKSCSTRRCSCVAANVARSLMCLCHGDWDTCCSESTKFVTGELSDGDVLNELTSRNGLETIILTITCFSCVSDHSHRWKNILYHTSHLLLRHYFMSV